MASSVEFPEGQQPARRPDPRRTGPLTFYTFICPPCGGVQCMKDTQRGISLLPFFENKLLADLEASNGQPEEGTGHPLIVGRVALRFLPSVEEAATMSKEMAGMFVAGASIPQEELDGLAQAVVDFNIKHGTSLTLAQEDAAAA